MSKEVTSKVSKKSKWWISEYRHMELRYFCRQYKEWRDVVNSVIERRPNGGDISRSVEDEVLRREKLRTKMRIVEEACIHADPELSKWLFKAVTEGYRYEYLRGVLDIPCGRRQFYERMRKFYWVLDKMV